MLQDLDETIRQILVKKGKLNGGDIDISFDQPTGEWAGGLTRPTINVYLYDIRENVELRNRQWTVERDANNKSRRVMEPMRVDLSYIVTVWTRNIEDEHRLLWRVLHTLAAQGTIQANESIGALVAQPYPIRAKVALQSEAIHNLPDLWGVMENQLRPAINYVLTMSLDLGMEIEAPLVTTSRFTVGQYDGDEDNRTLGTVDSLKSGNGRSGNGANGKTGASDHAAKPGPVLDHFYHVGGHVRRGNDLVAGARVEIADQPFQITSDAQGRYVFANVPPGEYTFRVQLGDSNDQPMVNRAVRVPADSVDGYDLTLEGGTSGTSTTSDPNKHPGATKQSR
jgi:hypothetical protein